jgi:predicted lysophospholipase L1 biosynthesis ABC-type transport system permease subunit
VANLLLVRIDGRHREMAMRRALGATRGELMRTQIAELLVERGLIQPKKKAA